MGMEQEYAWAFTTPARTLDVHMESFEEERLVFEAALHLERKEITGPSLAAALARYPWMTVRVLWGIYAQAFRLWLKGTPFFSHPQDDA
jgi:DUF1365 family protein